LDRNRTRQERTEWHNVVVWGKRAEALSKILNKGSRLFVEGSLRTSSYEDREGNKRYKTEITALNILLCGGRGATPAREGGPDFEDDAGAVGAPSGGYDDSTLGGDRGSDDEFPF
jgi:single-strand DNA-binding protein